MAEATVTQPTMPSIYMDPVTQQSILAQAQRQGWLASQPVPDVQVGQDNVTGQPTVTVKGWTMSVSDPKTGQNDTLKLQYSPGGKQPWTYAGGAGDLKTTTTTAPDKVVQNGTIYTSRKPGDPGYDAKDPNTWWVASAVDQSAKDQAKADLQKTLVGTNLTQAQIDSLVTKNPAEVTQILASANLSDAQRAQVLNNIQIANASLATDLAQKQAQTAQATATAGQIESATDIAKQKAPSEIKYLDAQTVEMLKRANYTDAQIDELRQKITQANAPAIKDTGAGMYVYQQDPTSGQLTPQYNANFVPKTQADVAGRVGQLQQMAAAQRDAISQKLQSGAYGSGPDAQAKAAAEFDQWWNQNVEPQKGQLQAAQSQAAQEQARLQSEQDRSNYQTALTAGTNAVEAAKAQMPYMVGPGFGQAVNQLAGAFASGKPAGNLDIGSAITFNMPDFQALATQATNQALAHLSPTAANGMNASSGANTANFGPTMAQPQDINQGLNRQNYQFGGGPQPAQQTVTGQTVPVQGSAQVAPVGAVAGQNYGAGTAYTGGILPWNAQPSPALSPEQFANAGG